MYEITSTFISKAIHIFKSFPGYNVLSVCKEKHSNISKTWRFLFTVQVSCMQHFLKKNKDEISKNNKKKNAYYFLQNSNIQK